MLYRLSGEGVGAVKGRLTLGDAERKQLLAGRLALVVYSKDNPHGTARALLTPHTP
jgi:hypothetical protein